MFKNVDGKHFWCHVKGLVFNSHIIKDKHKRFRKKNTFLKRLGFYNRHTVLYSTNVQFPLFQN